MNNPVSQRDATNCPVVVCCNNPVCDLFFTCHSAYPCIKRPRREYTMLPCLSNIETTRRSQRTLSSVPCLPAESNLVCRTCKRLPASAGRCRAFPIISSWVLCIPRDAAGKSGNNERDILLVAAVRVAILCRKPFFLYQSADNKINRAHNGQYQPLRRYHGVHNHKQDREEIERVTYHRVPPGAGE